MPVFPVLIPTINWLDFVRESSAALDRSPTDSLDRDGIPPGLLRSFVAALGEFHRPGTHPIPYLRSHDCERALEHLSFSFLFVVPSATLGMIATLGVLAILLADSAEDEPAVALVTGSLRDWRRVIRDANQRMGIEGARSTLREILPHFYRLGLGELFRDPFCLEQTP